MIRSRKSPSIIPSSSSLSETASPIPSSPFDPTEGDNCDGDDGRGDIEYAHGHGKEKRRLFFENAPRGILSGGNPTRCCFYEKNSNTKKRLSIAAAAAAAATLLLLSNAIVGALVYRWVSPVSSSFSTTATIASCPKDMVGFANWFANNLDPKRRASFRGMGISSQQQRKQNQQQQQQQNKNFVPVPPEHYKTFYYDGNKISMPIARALRSRGWIRVDETDNAHLIYTYSNHADWATELKPWQRFNYVPGHEKWNEKSNFVYYYKQYEQQSKKAPSVYVPESYMLTETREEIEAFRKVLEEGNGKDHPWVHKLSDVNQGRGITIMAPNSPELMGLPEESTGAIEDRIRKQKKREELKQKRDDEDSSRSQDESEDVDEDEEDFHESIIQRYICNEMTWNNRKFDVRMYWFVASLDPLVVLYHDGYVRVGNGVYSETSFADTTSHLTSHTGLGAETKAPFARFEEALHERHRAGKKPSFPHGNTPVEHVRNQFKHALGEMIEIMRNESFALPDLHGDDPVLSSENSFQFYCADFILDNDLDVWFIEPQNGCGLDEDYYFRLEMHASLFNGMADVLEEVGRKQERNEDLLPLEKSGNWEIIYADGDVYNYDGYERSKTKEGCEIRLQQQ